MQSYETFNNILDFVYLCFTDMVRVSNWFVSPVFMGLSPLMLLTFGGLTTFLTIAIVRWLI